MRRIVALTGVLLVTGCAAPPRDRADATPPALPAQWRAAPLAAAPSIEDGWWRGFGNAELSALVEQARVQSLDLAAADAGVRVAEASARIAGAALWPAVTASVGASRQGRLGGQASVDGTSVGVALGASQELDLWGRLRAASDSAQAGLRASAFERDAVRLTVTAAVAAAWLQAVALQERAGLAAQSLATAERLLALVDTRARAGAATALERAQQRGQVASQRQALAALRQQAEAARLAVPLLLGQAAPLAWGTATLADVALPAVDTGVPSALLARRPDIASAEARLAAADADVRAARAALLPSLSLTASAGTGGDRLRDVLRDPLYSLAAALAAPLFDAGRRAASRDLAQARREALLADYRQAIVTAFADVETTLNAAAWIETQIAAQDDALAQAERALALAESRYRAGAETLLVLLDAQRTRFNAQDAAVQLRLVRLQAAVSLYRALGGGWSVPAAQAGSNRAGVRQLGVVTDPGGAAAAPSLR